MKLTIKPTGMSRREFLIKQSVEESMDPEVKDITPQPSFPVALFGHVCSIIDSFFRPQREYYRVKGEYERRNL